MLIELGHLIDKHRLTISGVIHAGAHLAEEFDDYVDAGIANVWWLEANPNLIEPIQEKVSKAGHSVVQACLSDVSDSDANFWVSSNEGMSSSTLRPAKHLDIYGSIRFDNVIQLRTITLDDLNITGANFLNMDLQGAELSCLKGATRTLKSIDYIYTEVNLDNLYEGCPLMDEIDVFLSDFTRVETVLLHEVGWGDAFYVRGA